MSMGATASFFLNQGQELLRNLGYGFTMSPGSRANGPSVHAARRIGGRTQRSTGRTKGTN